MHEQQLCLPWCLLWSWHPKSHQLDDTGSSFVHPQSSSQFTATAVHALGSQNTRYWYIYLLYSGIPLPPSQLNTHERTTPTPLGGSDNRPRLHQAHQQVGCTSNHMDKSTESYTGVTGQSETCRPVRSTTASWLPSSAPAGLTTALIPARTFAGDCTTRSGDP